MAVPRRHASLRDSTHAGLDELAQVYHRSRPDLAEAAVILAREQPELFAKALATVPQLQALRGTGRRARRRNLAIA